MSHDPTFGLPRDLGDGLTLRWAAPDDAEAIASFNVGIHSDDPAEPDTWLYHWTHDLMSGNHPTTRAGDFTVVIDENERDENGRGKLVSTLCTISQTWAYDGIRFGVGRPELVGTLPEYRRRGLVRQQMAAVHARSAARGELVTAITGIPWYYRLFDYEMALDLGGSRQLYWARPGNDEKVERETYRVRPATADDIPVLAELYRAHLDRSPITRVRDEANWRYEMFVSHPESIYTMKNHLVLAPDDRVVAYANYEPWGTGLALFELGVLPGHSWRAVARFLVRYLKEEAGTLNTGRPADKQITNISFNLGQAHPVYDALGRDLEKQIRPYVWYIRVPDLPAFLRHIAPVLERRLAGSVLAGHGGTTRVTCYRSRFTLVWEDGRLKEVGDTFEHKRMEEGDAAFPEQTFLQLLFGHRSFQELTTAYGDLFARNAETEVLLNVLFPKQPSQVIAMG